MSYIGNTPTTQSFTPAVDYFSGNGSTTAFTLSRPVASVAQVQVAIENVPQNPGDAFTVSGNTITFTSAPPSGTNNIYVYYTSPITQVIAPGQGTVGTAQLQDGAVITQDIADSAVTTAKIANANVTIAKLSATGTPSSTTYLRGDGAWSTVTSLPGAQGQAFTSNGTFTIPAGITAIKVTVVGGGGGGTDNFGSGGGGGGAAISFLTGLTPGGTLAVTVGAGGARNSSGGTSSVASGTQSISTISATGGSASAGSNAAGGSGSGGTLNIGGSDGNTGNANIGGASIFGGGGSAGAAAGPARSGKAYGGGGGGGPGCAAAAAGAAGVVIFEW